MHKAYPITCHTVVARLDQLLCNLPGYTTTTTLLSAFEVKNETKIMVCAGLWPFALALASKGSLATCCARLSHSRTLTRTCSQERGSTRFARLLHFVYSVGVGFGYSHRLYYDILRGEHWYVHDAVLQIRLTCTLSIFLISVLTRIYNFKTFNHRSSVEDDRHAARDEDE